MFKRTNTKTVTCLSHVNLAQSVNNFCAFRQLPASAHLFKSNVTITCPLFKLFSKPSQHSFPRIPAKPFQQVWKKAAVSTCMIWENKNSNISFIMQVEVSPAKDRHSPISQGEGRGCEGFSGFKVKGMCEGFFWGLQFSISSRIFFLVRMLRPVFFSAVA